MKQLIADRSAGATYDELATRYGLSNPGKARQCPDDAGLMLYAQTNRPDPDFVTTVTWRGNPDIAIRGAELKTEPRELTLKDLGYARGNYTFRCIDCDRESTGDKRAIRCMACATQALGPGEASAPSDKCEHGIPRQFCTAMHPEKTSPSLPPCECLLIAKEPSAYHALKCPRFVADKL